MSILIKFLDGTRVGQHLQYDESVERIVLGRDAAKCRVVFPAELTMVGREHCALKRVLGRYRLVINGDNPVYLDGQPAHDDQELAPATKLQLGDKGPMLSIETLGNSALPATMKRTGGRQAGEGTMVRNLGKSLRMTRLLAAVLLVVGIAVALVAWRSIRDVQKTYGDLAAKQASTISDLNERMQAMKAKMKPRVEEALLKGSPSVYLVLLKDPEGHETGVGTAWVAGAGVFGTNAHVAAAFNTKKENHVLFARSNATPPKDFTITKVQLHPGYGDFDKMWTEYKPARNTAESIPAELQGVAACDVALMWPETVEGLAPPLELAPRETLEALNSAEVIGFAGYPMEAMALGGVNLKTPVPTMQVGHVTAVTDFFLTKVPKGGGLLIHHNLPIAGGASGSPILNAEGKVVGLVSAGNLTINPTGVGRISTGVGVNFGQRVDMLKELMDGQADALQVKRSEQWSHDIRQFASLRQKILDHLVARWIEQLPDHKAVKLDELKKTLNEDYQPGVFVFKHALTMPKKGSYCLIAVGSTDKPINEYLFNAVGTNWGKEAMIASDESGGWYAMLTIEIYHTGVAELVVSGNEKDIPFTAYVFHAEK